MDTNAPFGLHIVQRLQTNNTALLQDASGWMTAMLQFLETQTVEVVGTTHYVFDNDGFTAAFCLKESHLCIHTWPELNQLTFDVFLCNYSRNNEASVQAVADFNQLYFDAVILTQHHLQR